MELFGVTGSQPVFVERTVAGDVERPNARAGGCHFFDELLILPLELDRLRDRFSGLEFGLPRVACPGEGLFSGD